MLKQLYIKNFTIIQAVDLEMQSGLTVLTGETGAGKSILVDALQIALGERAEAALIRPQSDRCEVSACFSVNTKAQTWLTENELDEGEECIISRVLSRDGRSRSTINGRPCTLQQVRELSALLAQIHGQNQQQSLLNNDYQRELLDAYAGHHTLCQDVANSYKSWQQLQTTLAELQALTKDQTARIELLQFQLHELNQLDLKENEVTTLEQEHKQLANAENIITHCQTALAILSQEDSTTIKGLHQAQYQLTHFVNLDTRLKSAQDMLNNALIQAEEAANEIQNYLDALELNPERLSWLEQRLTLIHDTARKHRVKPEELIELHQRLSAQLQQITEADARIAKLQTEIATITEQYQQLAQKLTISRLQAAKKLNTIITSQIKKLGMPNGKFEIQVQTNEHQQPALHGNDRIEFMINTNPGQPMQPLNKIASGGELSRIALAIQVTTAQKMATPTLIFDEVDVGIGGGVAEIVGQLLKTLAANAQVLCITHLPQVAAQGHHHLHVQKLNKSNSTETTIKSLNSAEKIQEIARMLGGVKITERTLAHAKEMLGVEVD